MARFKLTIEYEGTRFSGWQVQKNARTVQGEIHAAIGELDAGRTVSHEKAATWLRSWGTAGEKKAPRGFIRTAPELTP